MAPVMSHPREEIRHPVPRLPWLLEYVAALAVVGLCVIVSVALRPHLPQANLIMIYLIGVVAIAAQFRRQVAMFASLASVAAFDFFCVKPYLSFWVSSEDYL